MAEEQGGSGLSSAGETGSNAPAPLPDEPARGIKARRAHQASHMAPSAKKGAANPFKATRHVEETGVMPVPASDGASAPSEAKATGDPDPEGLDGTLPVEASPDDAPAPEGPYVEESGVDPDRTMVAPEPLQTLTVDDVDAALADGYEGDDGTMGDGAEADMSAGNPKRRLSGAQIAAIVCGSVAAGLLAIYVGVSLHFQSTFMPNTTLNGKDVSNASRDEVLQQSEAELADYSLGVTGDGLDFSIGADEAGLSFDGDAYIANAIAETEPWTWPVTVWTPRDITTDQGTTFDAAKVTEIVDGKVEEFNKGAEPPADAAVSYDEGTGSFLVKEASVGTQVDPKVVEEQVNEAIATLQPTVELGEDALLQPTVMADDEALRSAAQKANGFLDTEVTLTMNGQEAKVIDNSLIKDWVVLGENGDPTLDTNAITEWGKNELSQQLDTVSRERSYTRVDGKQITVPGGTYGWSIDSAALAPRITEAVTSGESQTIDVPVLQSADQPPDEGGRDWGNRYIDVDLSSQYAWMYGDDGSVIWESPIVSGKVSDGHSTPAGVYYIDSYFNKSDPSTTLVGYYPGTNEKEYENHVSYWMPFIGNSIGLHDADWRSSFGGSINEYNGSHGCVNLPVGAASELAKIVNQGDVVVVHY